MNGKPPRNGKTRAVASMEDVRAAFPKAQSGGDGAATTAPLRIAGEEYRQTYSGVLFVVDGEGSRADLRTQTGGLVEVTTLGELAKDAEVIAGFADVVFLAREKPRDEDLDAWKAAVAVGDRDNTRTRITRLPAWSPKMALRTWIDHEVAESSLPEDVIKHLIGLQDSGDERPPTYGPTPEHFPLTDLGNAERLVERHKHELRYCQTWGKWLVWDGRRWLEDDSGAVGRFAHDTARSIYGEAERAGTSDLRRQLAKHAIESEKSPRLSAMEARARYMLPVRHGELNRDPWLLNVKNGTVDLRTGKIRSHHQADYLTKLAPVVYDEVFQCPLWLETLNLVFHRDDPDETAALVTYLQRLFGSALVGEAREHILPVFYGDGSNGKSTILKTMLGVLGDYGATCPASMLMARLNEQHPTELATLFGARLAVAMETGAGHRLNEQRIKALTGGDPIPARRMREDYWTFLPTHTLFLATNHKPKVKGTDEGIWRRLKLVPFTVKIPADQCDKAVPEKLRKEYDGIFGWAVQGCLDWQREGLGEPAEVTLATIEYREEEDSLGRFLQEETIQFPGAVLRATPLFARYKQWTEQRNERPMTQTAFGRAMTEKGLQRGTGRNREAYVNVALRAESLESDRDDF